VTCVNIYVWIVFCVLQVAELFSAMRDQSKDGNSAAPNNGRSFSSAATLTSLCADISPSSSHFFEVCITVL
jgi:TBC1 domain-containing protein 4